MVPLVNIYYNPNNDEKEVSVVIGRHDLKAICKCMSLIGYETFFPEGSNKKNREQRVVLVDFCIEADQALHFHKKRVK